MHKTYYTYIHCKPDGEPFYVGKGSGKRAYLMHRRNLHHKNIVKKYGEGNIKVYIFDCDCEESAFADEIHQIQQLKNLGYNLANITNGGEGVSGLSKPVSDEQREKLRVTSIGNKNALGYKHSEESLKKISNWNKNRKDRIKIMANLAKNNQKPVYCITTGEIFESVTQAAVSCGIKHKCTVSKCCLGKAKTANGLRFVYASTMAQENLWQSLITQALKQPFQTSRIAQT